MYPDTQCTNSVLIAELAVALLGLLTTVLPLSGIRPTRRILLGALIVLLPQYLPLGGWELLYDICG